MPAPTLSAAPSAAELAALDCPVDRAVRISQVARLCGTLPPALSILRRGALQEAREAGHRVAALAARVGLSPARVSQLTVAPRPAVGVLSLSAEVAPS